VVSPAGAVHKAAAWLGCKGHGWHWWASSHPGCV